MPYKQMTIAVLTLVTAVAMPTGTLAADQAPVESAGPQSSGTTAIDGTTEIDDLKADLVALQAAYDEQIRVLEERIARLEEASQVAEPAAGDELSALRAAAEETASTAGPFAPDQPPPGPAPQLSLNRLNPEISATGIISGIASDVEREEFQRGEFELDIQAALDPFSRVRWTTSFTEEGDVEVEEGYVLWGSLPAGLSLTAGKFRQRFGALNRQHLHSLPQTSYPLAIESIFGEDGLGQVGLSATWLLPKPWASANEISLELTDGENEFFAGENFEDQSLLARLNNYWDLSPATYFEWGLTGIVGQTAESGVARVWETDFTLHWQPPARAMYREITWRAEVMLAQRENVPGEITDSWGAYTYLEGLLTRNLYLGTRLDWSESPYEAGAEAWAVVPYLTWWQSEWVRFRGEYEYREDRLTGEHENRFTLQLTWAAGPHKHDTY